MEITIENIGKEQDKYLESIDEPLWLTEDGLGNCLAQIFPTDDIIHDKTLKIDGKKFRPDYLIKEKNICVEFQGIQHFTIPSTTHRDTIKKDTFIENGYKFIEIPYFIQLTKEFCYNYFYNLTDEKNFKDFSNGFPHGFIHPKAKSFGHFCYEGLKKAEYFLAKYDNEVVMDCYKSLSKRAEVNKIPELTLNPTIPRRRYLENTSAFIDIFLENEDWLFNTEEKYTDENMRDVVYNNFLNLGNDVGRSDFDKDLKIFLKITQDLWCGGDPIKGDNSTWFSKNEAWNCFLGYLLVENEISRENLERTSRDMLKAVDMFSSYS